MSGWTAGVDLTTPEVTILVTDEEGHERLRARLPVAHHPRGLLSLLEALALWSGARLRAAISVDGSEPVGSDDTICGLDLWPVQSALIELEHRLPPRHRDRLDRRDFVRLVALVEGCR